MSKWLIPWQTRGRSWAVDDNLLWNDGHLYVMDNHRLALWCWWQHLEESRRWNFIHIDRHYDALWQTFDPWPAHTLPEHRTDLHAFRTATIKDGNDTMELYRWDTITSALWSLHKTQLKHVLFATAGERDIPDIEEMGEVNPWKLPGVVRWLAERDEDPLPRETPHPWIVDIDLDYFTKIDDHGAFGPVFADEYVREIGRYVAVGLDAGLIGVVTVALSPETTGSWELAEHFLAELLSSFPALASFTAGAPKAV